MIAPAQIDMAFEFPKEMFDAKDELNYIYLYKRSVFLMAIAEAIAKKLSGKLYWEPFRGHPLKPNLVYKLEEEDFEIRIHITLPMGTIKKHRLGPGASLVHREAFLACQNCLVKEDAQLPFAPSPLYNALILADMLPVEHLKLLHGLFKKLSGLPGAIKLVKLWIKTMGYSQLAFAPTGFQLSMILAYLCERGLVALPMNEIQIFRALLQFIISHDFSKITEFKNLDLESFVPKDCRKNFSEDNFKRVFAAILLEPVAGLNILFDWTVEIVALLKRDAVYIARCLDEDKVDWQELLVQDQDYLQRFDKVYNATKCQVSLDASSNAIHYYGEFIPQVAKLKLVGKKLKFGFESRAESIMVTGSLPERTLISKEYCPEIERFQVLLLLDREESQRLVDLGPHGDTDEAKLFRHFWQNKSELKRFPDGSVREAVTWEKLRDRRHLIIDEIYHFVGEKHLKFAKLGHSGDMLKSILPKCGLHNDLEATIAQVTSAMMQITDLPLGISKCEVISANGRLTGLNQPSRQLVEILIYLEASNRWPSDYYGLLYAKQVFMAKICENLQERLDIVLSMSDDFVEFEFKGQNFRCRLFQEMQISLMKTHGLDVSELLVIFEHLPRHVRAISTLSRGNSLFGLTCRCLKWFIAQCKLSNRLPEELLELVVAYIFLHECPPNSIIAAFYRSIRLFAEYPWGLRPLLVDFDSHSETFSQWRNLVRAKFDQRPTDTTNSIPLWIAPSYETQGDCSIWSINCTLTSDELYHLSTTCKAICHSFSGDDGSAIEISSLAILPFNLEIALKDKHELSSQLLEGLFDEQEYLEPVFIEELIRNFCSTIERDYPNLRVYRGLDSKVISVFVKEASPKELAKLAKNIRASYSDFVIVKVLATS